MPGIITSTITASKGSRTHEFEPLWARRGQAHAVALARQQRVEDLAHDLFVVDDENRALTSHDEAALPGYWPAP